MDENAVLYNVDEVLIQKNYDLHSLAGFDKLKGADLVFACIAAIEDAYLVTLDKAFGKHLNGTVKVIDLHDSRRSPNYRRLFEN